MAAYCLQGAVYQGVPCLAINNLLMLQQVFTFLINNNQQSDLKDIQNENKTCNEDGIPVRHAVKMRFMLPVSLYHICAIALTQQLSCPSIYKLYHCSCATVLMQTLSCSSSYGTSSTVTQPHSRSSTAAAALLQRSTAWLSPKRQKRLELAVN